MVLWLCALRLRQVIELLEIPFHLFRIRTRIQHSLALSDANAHTKEFSSKANTDSDASITMGSAPHLLRK
jgi:hypothetical protein